jgi:putative component of toxin-antitoxin plasmid stabilization module
MRLTVITSSTWIIAAVVDDRGRCSVREALDAVAVSDRAAHAQLLALLGRVSQAGPPLDERRSRRLGEGIFELKTPRGFRLVYFFERKRLIVCSELCRKPKPRELRGIIRRATNLRATYVAASAAGEILVEIGG